MNYEIVKLEEKIVIGVSAKTSNSDPMICKTIGGLWDKFYKGGIHETVKNKANQYAIGLYSDYCGDNYYVTVGNEVTKSENNELTTKIIPAGNYAKFKVHGNMQTAVSEAWGKIWQMDLDRSFTGDFEEYLNDDFENADINIYIALK
jgi:predicted transcriptional regulator YdeE